MTRVVVARTGARLHFGLFGTKAEQGRLGGIGMMIDRPGYVLRGRIGHEDAVSGDDPHAVERVRAILWRLAKLRKVQAARRRVDPSAVAIEVVQSIPAHHGFGSGTQLAFALADLLTALGIVTIDDPSNTFERGRRSVVGSLGHQFGGFIVDFGHELPERIERRIMLEPVPERWRFVIVAPSSPETWSGPHEADAFRSLAPLTASQREKLVRFTTDVVLPAIRHADHQAFASGVAAFNRLVGEHFAPVQGGVYAHPLIRELAHTLADTDWPHLAQSSWGPAAVVFCESQSSAEELHAVLNRRLPRDAADVFVAQPKNDGASVTVIDA